MVGSTQIFGGPNPQPRDICEIIAGREGHVRRRRAHRVDRGEGAGGARGLRHLVHPRRSPSAARRRPRQPARALRQEGRRLDGARLGHDRDEPMGTVSRLKSYMRQWPEDAAVRGARQAGLRLGRRRPAHRGRRGARAAVGRRAMGEIQVRGPWIVRAYYDNPGSADRFTADGWFRTGDVATIDPEGYVQITDRTKDLIKSGGEWISSHRRRDHDHGPPEGAGGRRHRRAPPQVGRAAAGLRRPQARGDAGAAGRSSTFCAPGWPSGRCPTRSSCSKPCPRPASASSTRRSCGSASRTGRRRERKTPGLRSSDTLAPPA